jgi:hypothetical protein
MSRNLQHGGGSRIPYITETAHAPGVIALSEYRTKPGVPLCAALAARGRPTTRLRSLGLLS